MKQVLDSGLASAAHAIDHDFKGCCTFLAPSGKSLRDMPHHDKIRGLESTTKCLTIVATIAAE